MAARIATSTVCRTAMLVGVGMAAGCGQSSSPMSMPSFEYKATAVWTTTSTPNVTSMMIDGQSYASGQYYTVDEVFPSYDDARATFVPRNVVITTTTDTATFQIDLGACENVMPGLLDMPLTTESDEFDTFPSTQQPPGPSVTFGVDCGSCGGKDRTVYYCP